MDITCISDLHGFYPTLEGGDLLIVAGDLTARDTEREYQAFNDWLCKQNYKKIVVIAGNHDGLIEKDPTYLDPPPCLTYLCDSGTEFGGLKIWGSPYTPTFGNWHFMRNRGEAIKKHWDLIPADTNILVTHGPTFGTLDKTIDGRHAGCEDLLDAIDNLNLKLHVFGHIHEAYGQFQPSCIINYGDNPTPFGHLSVNCSHVNEHYRPVNKPIRVIL